MASTVKGRPRKENKNIRFSCTLTPAQLEWLNKTADEMGIERSAVLRNCVDRIIEEDTLCYLCKSTVEENNKIQFGKPICNECYKIYKKHGTAHLR